MDQKKLKILKNAKVLKYCIYAKKCLIQQSLILFDFYDCWILILANRVGSKKESMNDYDHAQYHRLQQLANNCPEMIVFNKWIPERAAIANSFKEKELNETIISHLDQLWPELEKIEVN